MKAREDLWQKYLENKKANCKVKQHLKNKQVKLGQSKLLI